MEAIDKSATDSAISRTPLGRLGKAEDIANAVAFSGFCRCILGHGRYSPGGRRSQILNTEFR
jgi:hypothetical protein